MEALRALVESFMTCTAMKTPLVTGTELLELLTAAQVLQKLQLESFDAFPSVPSVRTPACQSDHKHCTWHEHAQTIENMYMQVTCM